MKMLFKQRFFSWFDSYDIYDESGNTLFTVEGKLSWGHCLHILDASGQHIGTVQEKVFALMPQFELYAAIGTLTASGWSGITPSPAPAKVWSPSSAKSSGSGPILTLSKWRTRETRCAHLWSYWLSTRKSAGEIEEVT